MFFSASGEGFGWRATAKRGQVVDVVAALLLVSAVEVPGSGATFESVNAADQFG
jgi:hypothetical protein